MTRAPTKRRFDRAPTRVMGARLVALAVAGAVPIASPSPARAEPPPVDVAVELYRTSGERYREGRFAEAAELLREAYRRAPDAVLLYNLARACEGMGDLPCAIDAYQRYLKDASPPDRGAIERRIATHEKALQERAELEERRSRPAAPAEPAPSPPPAAPPAKSASLAPWLVGSLGAAVAGTGGVLLLVSHVQHEAAVAEPVHDAAVAQQDRAESTMTVATVALAAGGALLVGGIVWGVVDARSRRAGASQPTSGIAVGPFAVRVTLEF